MLAAVEVVFVVVVAVVEVVVVVVVPNAAVVHVGMLSAKGKNSYQKQTWCMYEYIYLPLLSALA